MSEKIMHICKNCDYGKKYPAKKADDGSRMYTCHSLPPHSSGVDILWPEVKWDDFCPKFYKGPSYGT